MTRIATLMVLLALPMTCANVVAADGTSTADQVKALKDLQDLLDAQKKVIEAQKDLLSSQKGLLEAQFPKISGGKEGTFTVGTGSADSFHAQVQTYHALQTAASNVCGAVKAALTKEQKTVVLVSADDIKMTGQYRMALNRLQVLQKMFEKANSTQMNISGFGLPLYGAAAALTALSDFTKLFRSNRTLYAETTTVTEEELTNLIAICLTKSSIGAPPANATVAGLEAIYPAISYDQPLLFGTSEFVDGLQKLDGARAQVDAEVTTLEGKAKESRTSQEEAKLAALRTLAARHTKFAEDMASSEENSKTPLLFYVLRGEVVAKAVDGRSNLPLLTARISKQGGFNMLTSSIWRSDRLFSSGGVVVSYRLVSGDKLSAAGSVPAESPLVEVQKAP